MRIDNVSSAHALPPEILQRATRAGNEYAWSIRDIPEVIEAARLLNLVNIGGQLQFRLQYGVVCECYWVQVDTYKSVDKSLPWEDRVRLTAQAAVRDFYALRKQFDFLSEGRLGFAEQLDALIAQGLDPADSMYFVWYVKREAEA